MLLLNRIGVVRIGFTAIKCPGKTCEEVTLVYEVLKFKGKLGHSSVITPLFHLIEDSYTNRPSR